MSSIANVSDDVHALVAGAARAAKAASASLAAAGADAVTAALYGIAERLEAEGEAVLAANERDVAGLPDGTSPAFADRLTLSRERLARMAAQIVALAESPDPEPGGPVRELAGGVRVEERRRPVGVIGANYEARPNVTVDVASQLLKSRNAGVLRTGGAALRTASLLMDRVVAPALESVAPRAETNAVTVLPRLWRTSSPENMLTGRSRPAAAGR